MTVLTAQLPITRLATHSRSHTSTASPTPGRASHVHSKTRRDVLCTLVGADAARFPRLPKRRLPR
jgi:hypothetical protein